MLDKTKTKEQLTINFEVGFAERHGSLRDAVAAGIYRRGLSRVAIELDQSPSNLSVQISADTSRHFSIDSLEKYIKKTGDLTPIHYLIDKYMAGQTDDKEVAIAELKKQMKDFQELLSKVVG